MQRQTNARLAARLLYHSELVGDYNRQIGGGHGLVNKGKDLITRAQARCILQTASGKLNIKRLFASVLLPDKQKMELETWQH
jgi:hypothetical protein